MTNQPQNAPSDVLPYATPHPPAEWLPPPAWLKLTIIALALLILSSFLLGLPPLSGALDYTRDIPLNEAARYAWAKGFRGTLNNAMMILTAMFAPAAVAGLAAFLCVRGVVPQRMAVAANVILPALWLMLFWPIVIVAGPPVLVAAWTGHCDGETWSEGFVSYAAMGSWTTMWLAVTLVLVVRRRMRSGNKTIRPADLK